MKKTDARLLMNKYGKEGTPFFFIIDFLQSETEVLTFEELSDKDVSFETPHIKSNHIKCNTVNEILLKAYPLSFEEYSVKFDEVVRQIRAGNSFLVNLTCKTPLEINCSLAELYSQSTAKYKLYYKNKFVVFSPETFIKTSNGKIFSYPMKGTIDAEIPDALNLILSNSKEMAEHSTIVDLIRNDLSMVATDIKVERFRYSDKIRTNFGEILQISSEISGILPNDYREKTGDIVFSLLPAGSVTGAPKKKTVEIILSAEDYDRGYYTGIFGVFDGNELDTSVMIRFIELSDGKYCFKSGGGITAYSSVNDEYDELIKKIYVPVGRKHKG